MKDGSETSKVKEETIERNLHACYEKARYRDLFRLADGDSIRIIKSDGTHTDRTCRYISETHMTCGWDDRLYHIHDFA